MLFTYSKMTMFDCLKPLTLSAVGNNDRMLRNKFVIVCKYPGGGTQLTVKCPAPGTHRQTNARGLLRWFAQGRMLAVGIDSHIRVVYTDKSILQCIDPSIHLSIHPSMHASTIHPIHPSIHHFTPKCKLIQITAEKVLPFTGVKLW